MAESSGQDSVSPAFYSEFIAQLELRNVWLHSCSVTNRLGPAGPETAKMKVADRTDWSPGAKGFDAYTRYAIEISTGTGVVGQMEVSFGLRFDSEIPMSDPLFEVFGRHNLPFNVWPYLREFLGSNLARMGWAQFNLPLLKRIAKRPTKAKPANDSKPNEAKPRPSTE